MSLNYYKLYIGQVMDLAKTMVIKVEAVADSINERLKATHGIVIDPEDKETWKYYLNLSGLYHHTDAKIYVTSLDTLETIELNRDNLLVHRATAKAYQYGTRYYLELLTLYPDCEQFILGCLYPVDLAQAIAAPDFTVLGYPRDLIETNEVSLVEKINDWLYGFKERWYNRQFTLTDTNYVAAFLSVMYLQLPPLIISLRLRACKTAEAHLFHVREYLESHGMLDVYLSSMTPKQSLFFYRNINYIERNSGKKETFDWLVEKVMTDRRLPLSEFNMKHDITDMPEELTPKAMFKKRLLNEETRIYEQSTGFYNLAYILSKEEPIARGNSEYRLIHENIIEAKFENTLTDHYKTKILESAMLDYNDALSITLADVVLNNWIYLSQTDRYTAFVPVTNPVSGAATTVSVKVALILFLHAYCMANGLSVTHIPPFVASRVALDPVPTVDEIYSVVDQNYVPREYIDFIKGQHVPVESMISTARFTEWCREHHTAANQQMFFVSNQEHMYTRGLMQNAVNRLYQIKVIDNEFTGQSFETVLRFNNIDMQGLNSTDWTRLYTAIYKSATGIELNATSASNDLQKSMISLMRQLSSYSIQFVQSINQSTIKVINWSAIRLGDVKYTSRALYRVQVALMKVFKINMQNNPKFKIELPQLLQNFTLRSNLAVDFIDIPVNIMGDVKIKIKKIVDLGVFKINESMGPYCAGSNLFNVPLYKAYYDLTPEQKSEVKDVYTNYPTADNYIANVDIESIAGQMKIGVDYVKPRLNILDSYVHFYVNKTQEAFYNNDIRVVLDGFYSNIENTYVDNHQVFKGYYKAASFRYMQQVPEATELSGETYTGGVLLGPLYNLKKLGDLNFEAPRSVAVYENGSLVFDPVYLNFDITNHWYNYAHVSFAITYRSLAGSIQNIEFLNYDLDAGALASAAGEHELDVKPTYFEFEMRRVPTQFNYLGGYGYYSLDADFPGKAVMYAGIFDLGALQYASGNVSAGTKMGGGQVTLEGFVSARTGYMVTQNFSAVLINKTINNITVVSHRVITKFQFVYVNRSIDITNWRL